MSFAVLGFRPGKDEPVFEQNLSLVTEELKTVMGWKSEDDHVGVDFRLSVTQVLEIERLESVAFPHGLDLYLTSYE
ncbi:hypothetical protein [Pseudomonas sp. RGM2987]|uniref:hypothetical protein n=1 Tax=Pseudomonas sp. RGM2987 TaxID=2930090 RepID=UPI001FD71F74|nr:hypothetical protein [Pseudomonas sp. RGM2987]MCJ8206119.1 hypothetical protein [Pseudomonas sp. RGM2987]